MYPRRSYQYQESNFDVLFHNLRTVFGLYSVVAVMSSGAQETEAVSGAVPGRGCGAQWFLFSFSSREQSFGPCLPVTTLPFLEKSEPVLL